MGRNVGERVVHNQGGTVNRGRVSLQFGNRVELEYRPFNHDNQRALSQDIRCAEIREPLSATPNRKEDAMRITTCLAAAAITAVSGAAWADHTCSATSNVCSHTVDTGSTSPVDLGGGGHTADKREWVVAPEDKYFVNAIVRPEGYTGRNTHCEIGASDGVQQRQVPIGDGTVSMTFVKKHLVVAHAETGSGPTNISHTAMMVCDFNAEIVALPK
jgi:hypothetical protein